MKQRLAKALIIGVVAAGVGIGVAIQLDQRSNMAGIGIAAGLVEFVFGLVFKFRVA